MLVRLAFSVAAHLEPEILLIDEVLAVGDAEFQKKCLWKMGNIAKEGRTVLFVSHNMGAVNSLTQKCIYLRSGQIVTHDDTRKVIEQYLLESVEHHRTEGVSVEYYRRDPLSIDSPAEITEIWVGDGMDYPARVELGDSFTLYVRMQVNREIRGAQLTVKVKDPQGQLCTILYSPDQGFSLSLPPGKHTVSVQVENNPLAPGQYFANIGLNQSAQTRAFDVISDFPVIQIVNSGQVTEWLNRPWGVVHTTNNRWQIEDRDDSSMQIPVDEASNNAS